MTWSSSSSSTPAASASCAIAGAVDQDVPVPGGLLGRGHRRRHVVHVGDQRPLLDLARGLVAGENEDRDAVVVVAAPIARRLDRSAAGDDRPGGHELVDHLAVDVPQAARLPEKPHSCRRSPPSPSPLSVRSLGPAMNPSRDIDM